MAYFPKMLYIYMYIYIYMFILLFLFCVCLCGGPPRQKTGSPPELGKPDAKRRHPTTNSPGARTQAKERGSGVAPQLQPEVLQSRSHADRAAATRRCSAPSHPTTTRGSDGLREERCMGALVPHGPWMFPSTQVHELPFRYVPEKPRQTEVRVGTSQVPPTH